jgi:hypothetical protein
MPLSYILQLINIVLILSWQVLFYSNCQQLGDPISHSFK